MLKWLARFILKNESLTNEHTLVVDENFRTIESQQCLMKSLINRNDSQMKNLREDMKILQTRQVNILNRMQRLEK